MANELVKRIERAQVLLQTVGNAAMATVCADGSPHNTPLFIAFDASYQYVYWSSDPSSLHSKNVARTATAFFVLYGSLAGGGLYFAVNEIAITEDAELAEGLLAYNLARVNKGRRQPLLTQAFITPYPQRLYRGAVTIFSVNVTERDGHNRIVRDYRQEITACQLRQHPEDSAV